MYPGWPDDLRAHEDVLAAEGFLALQLGVEVEEAAEVLQGHARVTGRALPEVAGDVCAGRLRFGVGEARPHRR